MSSTNPPRAPSRGVLYIRLNNGSSSRRLLTESVLVIGRVPGVQLMLDHHTVSRRHAEMFLDLSGRWRIRDLGSTNETLVNDERVTERILRSGDKIALGDFTLTFRAPLEEAPIGLAAPRYWDPAGHRLSEGDPLLVGLHADDLWKHKEQAAFLEAEAPAGHDARCALFQASVGARVHDIHPALIGALVRYGLWSMAQGLAFARSALRPADRVEALTLLVPLMSEWQRDLGLEEALDIAFGLEDARARARALSELAPLLPPTSIHEVLTAAHDIEDSWARANMLVVLAPLLHASLLSRALDEAKTIDDPWERERAHAALTSGAPPTAGDRPVSWIAPRTNIGYTTERMFVRKAVDRVDTATESQRNSMLLSLLEQESERPVPRR